MRPEAVTRPAASVVDYEAWQKGYTPPSEHVLIDQLAYRGARVVLSCDYGGTAYWLVLRGSNTRGKLMLSAMRAIEAAVETLGDEPAPEMTTEHLGF